MNAQLMGVKLSRTNCAHLIARGRDLSETIVSKERNMNKREKFPVDTRENT